MPATMSSCGPPVAISTVTCVADVDVEVTGGVFVEEDRVVVEVGEVAGLEVDVDELGGDVGFGGDDVTGVALDEELVEPDPADRRRSRGGRRAPAVTAGLNPMNPSVDRT